MVTPNTHARRARASMRALPTWLQPMLTWLTGLPLPGERPAWTWTPAGRVTTAVALLVTWVTVAAVAAAAGGAWWLVAAAGSLLVTGAVRYLYIVVSHFAVHGSLALAPRTNRLAGELVAGLTLTQAFDRYALEHAKYHHSSRLGTRMDPDTRFITSLGFERGMSMRQLRRQLWWTLVSPRFHAQFMRARLAASLGHGPLWRRVSTVAVWAVLLTAATLLEAWPAFLVAWLLPVTVFYNASALFQFMSEHRWLRVRRDGESAQAHQAKLTFGRFLGDAVPTDGRLTSWAIWWTRLLVLHLPARCVVLVGDLPQHDYHHLRPRGEWANAIYTREAAVEAGWVRTDDDEQLGSLLDHVDTVFRELAESTSVGGSTPTSGGDAAPVDGRAAAATIPGVLATMAWGSSFVLTKLALRDFQPTEVAGLRFVLAALLFGALYAVRLVRWEALTGAEWARVTVMSAAGIVAYQVALVEASTTLPAYTVAIAAQLAPLFTLLLQSAADRRWPTPRAALALTVSSMAMGEVLGLWAHADTWTWSLHHLLLLVPPLGLGIFNVLSRPLVTRHAPMHVTALSVLVGAIGLGCLHLSSVVLHAEPLLSRASEPAWLAVVALAAVSTVGGFGLWFRAVRHGAQMSRYLPLVPVFGVLTATLTLGETLTPTQWAAMGVAVGAVAWAGGRPPVRG